jgi:hypothetical protein
MMPIYYTNQPLTEKHANSLSSTWTHIIQNSSPIFIKSKNSFSNEEFPFESTIDWFGKIFYQRLFDIHPVGMI